MSVIKQRILASLLPLSAYVLCFGMAAQAQSPQRLPINQSTDINGVQTACTGIGNEAEREARWNNFPVKLETVGGYGQWLGDQNVTVEGQGQNVSVHCAGPWLLMNLQPGRYDATVSVPNASPKHISFRVPATGQRSVIVRFPSKSSGEEQSRGM